MKGILGHVWAQRRLLLVLLTPLLLLPLLLCGEGQESSCAYVIVIMAVFWVFEALPINITALLPVFLFPMVGVMSANDVAGAFFKSTSLMFTGGMMVAVAVERWQLHVRVALRILLVVGSKPVWLMLGLMLTAWFLSMWISNTATTAMMLPIAAAIVDELCKLQRIEDHDVRIELTAIDESSDQQNDVIENGQALSIVSNADRSHGIVTCSDMHRDRVDRYHNNQMDTRRDVTQEHLHMAFCLCIAYAANIGGTGSLTGTVPNLVLQGQLGDVYARLGKASPITFGSWLLFGLPTSLVIVLLSWCWLQAYLLRCSGFGKCSQQDNTTGSKMKEVLKEQYRRLGPFSFAQVAVCVHFVVLVLLWITRDLGGASGWSTLFKDSFIKDSVPAILVGTSLFVFPSTVPFTNRNDPDGPSNSRPLLTWGDFTDKMPWGVIFLLGGGFSMAKAAEVSGLSAWLGNQLSSLVGLDGWVLSMCLCFIVAAATEVTSNTATTSLILPILADLSTHAGLEPIYIMLPVTIAASFAFMLPVATPPNAVIFASGHVRVLDMVKAGFLLNIIGVLVVVASMETLGRALYM